MNKEYLKEYDAKEKALNGRIVADLPTGSQLDKTRIRQIHVIQSTLGKQMGYFEQQIPKIKLNADGTEKSEVTEINKKNTKIF